jgi:hypothetical protein
MKVTDFINEEPDFGYSQYNDRENDFAKIDFVPHLFDAGFSITADFNGHSRIGFIECGRDDEDFSIAKVVLVKIFNTTGPYFKSDRKLWDNSWYGTGLGQTLYDKAIVFAKKQGYKFFRSDETRSAEAESAWKKLASRYSVTKKGNRFSYYEIDLSKVPLKISEGGGYIPQNEKEAHDPRYEMAMTCDIKPGEDVRQAAKFNFKLKKGGIPPTMRSDGKLTESKEQLNPALTLLSQQKVIGWDFLGTTFAGAASIEIANFILSHPKIKHYVITSLANTPKNIVSIKRDLAKVNPKLPAAFTSIIGSDPIKFSRGAYELRERLYNGYDHPFSEDERYVKTFKEQICKKLGITVLVDDEERPFCQQFGITPLFPIDCFPPKHITESKDNAQDTLNFLAKQSKIAWDLQGTLVFGGASKVIRQFILDHPEIKHYIITTESNGPDLQNNVAKDLAMANSSLKITHFAKIIGSDPTKFGAKAFMNFHKDKTHDSPEVGYLTDFKASMCKDMGIPVLVDDDLRRIESCQKYGIKWIDPYDLIPPKQSKSVWVNGNIKDKLPKNYSEPANAPFVKNETEFKKWSKNKPKIN